MRTCVQLELDLTYRWFDSEEEAVDFATKELLKDECNEDGDMVVVWDGKTTYSKSEVVAAIQRDGNVRLSLITRDMTCDGPVCDIETEQYHEEHLKKAREWQEKATEQLAEMYGKATTTSLDGNKVTKKRKRS